MLTRAELRRMRRIERAMHVVLPRLVRRVTTGEPAKFLRLPRRWLTVVSVDVDLDAGVGAIWMVWRPGSARAETRTVLIERRGQTWQYTGGGGSTPGDLPAERRAAGRSGQLGMIELGCGVRTASLEACELRLAAEVDHLLLGERRIDVTGNGALIVAWRSTSTGSGTTRPLIVAVGPDGAELSRLGPRDMMDSYTWAQLNV